MNEIKCPKCGNVFSVNEADYASIATQVRNKEFQDELSARLAEKEREYAMRQEMEIGKKEAEISRLKESLDGISNAKELEFKKILDEKEQEIARLNIAMAENEGRRKIAVLETENSFRDKLRAKDTEIAELKGKMVSEIAEVKGKAASEIAELKSMAASEKDAAMLREKSLVERFNMQLREKQEQIDYYKDLKTRMSTK